MIDPIWLFVAAGLFSPGPNVILLTASGARFGITRTLPHLVGVVFGVGVIAGLSGLGVGALLTEVPGLKWTLKIVAAAWIVWMAWTLWHRATGDTKAPDRPMTLPAAALFQWVNPKIWAVALAAASGYPAGLPPVHEAARLALIFSGTNTAAGLTWLAIGAGLGRVLTQPAARTRLGRAMAVLLAASAVMVFL
ncbi:MAG: LysE family transporter [Pseudomonadota bacterium]